MKDLVKLAPSGLIDGFLSISLVQYEAIESGKIRKYNRLYHRISEILETLKDMDGDQRNLLLALYAHHNIFVRLQSAIVTMEIAPSAARRVFEEVEASRIYPYAADAAGALRILNSKN